MNAHSLRRCAAWLASAALLPACTQPAPPAPGIQPVFVTTVRNQESTQSRVFTATVQPRYQTELGFRVGGKVNERLVEVGQRVRAGQALARLDSTDYRLGLASAVDQQRAADVDANQAAADDRRLGRLMTDGSVATADHERQKARADAADARREQARRQVGLALHRVDYTTLAAPFAGVVTAVQFEVGQVVGEGQRVISIARSGDIEIVADLPEQFATNAERWKVSGQLWERGGKRFDLRLRELAPVAAPHARTFKAKFSMVRPDAATMAELRLGMSVELTLERQGGIAATTLPVTALLKSRGEPSVWVVDAKAGTVANRPVRVIAYTQNTVVLAALPDGTKVVTVGAQKLDASMQVLAVERSGTGITLEGVGDHESNDSGHPRDRS